MVGTLSAISGIYLSSCTLPISLTAITTEVIVLGGQYILYIVLSIITIKLDIDDNL